MSTLPYLTNVIKLILKVKIYSFVNELHFTDSNITAHDEDYLMYLLLPVSSCSSVLSRFNRAHGKIVVNGTVTVKTCTRRFDRTNLTMLMLLNYISQSNFKTIDVSAAHALKIILKKLP